MKTRPTAFPMIGAVLLAVLFAGPAVAEQLIALNPDCDICPLAIAFDGDETKKMLSQNAVDRLRRVIALDQRTTKIDLDGMLTPGSENDSDAGYELVVYSFRHQITLHSIPDGATVKITTDYTALAAAGATDAWSPEIQLRPPPYHSIEKSDDLDSAWEKFGESMLVQFIAGDVKDRDRFRQKLAEWIERILGVVAA